MVDFNDFVDDDDSVDYTQFIKTFESLDPETTHTELRATQIDALELLQENRKEKDIILKLSTGAGKTTIGLLFLWSHMKEKDEPAVYLCPTVQLVKQVLAEASRLGMQAVDYPKKTKHPPVSGTTGKAIIVCTYDKLFNAKSTFNRADVQLRPCAIVFDDAHSGIERIKKSYSITLENTSSLYSAIVEKLRTQLETNFKSILESIDSNDPNAIFEVPYWVWKRSYEEIRTLFNKSADSDELKFTYPNFKNELRWARCVITGSGLEIQPRVLPVENTPAYENCRHRLFMSATLSEDSTLVRDLGCEKRAALKSLKTESDKGLGERMVIAPSLIHSSFDRKWVMKLAKRLSNDFNVVALCSREEEAREWEEYGAKIGIGDDVEPIVDDLKDKDSDMNFAVFAQRFDGVDLADRACRVLILDGIPRGESIIERHDFEKSIFSHGPQNKIIYKIEQGMGRAVRSHADYCVVILAGPDIGHYIAKHEVQSKMSFDTQSQLKLAINLVEKAISQEKETGEELKKRENAIRDMITKCLSRDSGWKKFYSKNVREKKQTSKVVANKSLINLAHAERQAYLLAQGNQFSEACQLIRTTLNDIDVDEKIYGWSLSNASNYLYEVDPSEAMEVQMAAHFKNRTVQPPASVIYKNKKVTPTGYAEKILDWLKSFEDINGASIALASLKSEIDFSNNYKRVEKAFNDLSEMLGAKGERPDHEYKDGGPDNLWFWGKFAFVIEVKSEKKSSLFKDEAGQMANSLNWFKERYPYFEQDNIRCLTVTDAETVGKEAFYPEGTRVLNQKNIKSLLVDLANFHETLIRNVLLTLDAGKIQAKANSFGLSPELFLDKYTFDVSKLPKVKK